jgi:methionyl-tRNA synthetase
LKAFNWVTWYGGKFSTSEKRGIFMDKALEILPSDYWRWYLMANAPESSDAAFTLEQFQQTINADLANVFGNFINRITRFAAAKFDSKVPIGGDPPGSYEKDIEAEAIQRIHALTQFHEQMEYRKAAAELRALWAAGNEYLQRAAPWTAIKTNVNAAEVSVRTGLNLAVLFAVLAQPFIPDAAKAVLDALNVPDRLRKWPKDLDQFGLLDQLPRGHKFDPPDVLFKKIEDDQVVDLAARFGGGGAD